MQADNVVGLASSIATHMPTAGLFGSNDVKSSYDNFHQLKARDIDGQEVNFADLKGKVNQYLHA